jgi:hypothetical protein
LSHQSGHSYGVYQYIRQLYAADHIAKLEESNDNNQHTNEIVKLSVDYHIMNSKTSFVVVEEKENSHLSSLPLPVTVPHHSGGERYRSISSGSGSGRGGSGVGTISSVLLCKTSKSCAFDAFSAPAQSQMPQSQSRPSGVFGFMSSSLSAGSAPPPPPPAPIMQLKSNIASRSAPKPAPRSSAMKRADESYDQEFTCEKSDDLLMMDDMEEFEDTTETRRERVVSARRMDAMDCFEEKKKKNSYNFEDFVFEGEVTMKENRNLDAVLSYKCADGSFSMNATALKMFVLSSDIISSFAKSHNFSEELTFNLFVLKVYKNDGSKKYVMIIRNLEKWIDKQLKSLTSTKVVGINELLPEISV